MFTKIRNMLEFLGEKYYIDVQEIDNKIAIPATLESTNDDGQNEPQISVSKWEVYKNLIDVVLSEREELDENLGIHSAKNLSIPFKFAFNTLLINNIIKKL